VADTKISALAAASAAAAANELAINEAGTSKKLTVAQLDTYVSPTVIASAAAPASGAFPDKGVGSEAWLLNTADNAVTTIEDVMTFTGLVAGTYLYEYFLVWRSGTVTVGCTWTVDYTGTVTRSRGTRHYQSTGTAAATGVADGTVVNLTGALVEHMSDEIDPLVLGPNTGVGSITEDQFDYVRGIIVVSTTADLKLQMTGEGGAAVTFKADSIGIVKRLA